MPLYRRFPMDYYVRTFGAVGDGRTNDASAIQRAIDACAARGGGRVVLESGHTYYSSSLHLCAAVELYLEGGSRLLAHSDLATYFRPNEAPDDGVNRVGTPVTGQPAYAFLYARDADFIRIGGTGTIDGNAWAFVKRLSPYYANGDFYPRPTLIYVEHCKHISFTDVTLCGAPFWTLHPAGCDDVLIRGLRILNDLSIANSDGIDPDHCTNVRILGCHIECADDCICLKTTAGNAEYGPTRGVVIADCTLVSTSAAIKIGTEGVDDFADIVAENCVISRSNRGISVQIRDGGDVENVSFSHIRIDTRRFADNWWGCGEPITITVHDRDERTRAGHVRGVRFTDITCDSENGVFLSGSPGNEIEDVRFDDVRINMHAKSKWPRGRYDLRPGLGKGIEEIKSAGFFLRDAKNVVLTGCTVKTDNDPAFGEPIATERCENIT